MYYQSFQIQLDVKVFPWIRLLADYLLYKKYVMGWFYKSLL